MNAEKNRRPVILGIFIILATAIIVAGVFSVGSQRKFFEKKFILHFLVADAEGLQPGHNVWLYGVKVGAIQKVTILNNNTILVSMNIEKKIQTHIFKNAKVKISTDGFIGNKIAVISGGSLSNGVVNNGDTLHTEKAVALSEMLTMLQNNNKNLLVITENFKSISQKMNEGKGTLGGLINDKSLLNDVQKTVDHFNKTAIQTELAAKNLSVFTYRLEHDTGLIHKIISDTSIYTSLAASAEGLRTSLYSFGSFMAELQQAGQKLNEKENTIGMFMNDTTTANHIQEIILNLRSSSKKLDEDLEALQHNFLFRNFFRKKNK